MKIIGHRGGVPDLPENTMAAFLAAGGLGADGIEFDVQRSSDGELIVIHDFTLDRTTTGTGLVSNASFRQIEALNAGVPRLVEVLALDDLDFELELKGFGTDFLDSVLSCVDDCGVLDQVEFTSSNVGLLMLLKSRHGAATVGYFSRPRHPSLTDQAFEHQIVGVAETAPFDVAHVGAEDISARIVERLHGLGQQVHANDAMTALDVERALDAGADRLSTNDVTMARAVVDRG